MDIMSDKIFNIPPRKLHVLTDEDTGSKYFNEKMRKKLNIEPAIKNRSYTDENLFYQQAKSKSKYRVIITDNKHHFWNDEDFPLEQTSGIIILNKSSPEEEVQIINKCFNSLCECRYCNAWWMGLKLKVLKTGFTVKFKIRDSSTSEKEIIYKNNKLQMKENKLDQEINKGFEIIEKFDWMEYW